ncbi:tetratricopeptide repeat protein [Humisphaera borealis]|uniref:Tetratricopeptide repeat protein n=1 Tax=Humisphaera borealis TaxID=2807512 RepID=A0A7M2X2X0_9BACT|nr:hypothetical protein [Humisphaera borealis]QOV92116.1 hypothetical protein IPV69_12475 [Humisphaera borealis]
MLSESQKESINEAIGFLREGRFPDAELLLMELIKENPSDGAVNSYLAWSRHLLDRDSDAIEPARRGVLLAPKSEKASTILFHVLMALGKAHEALLEMWRFLGRDSRGEYFQLLSDLMGVEEHADSKEKTAMDVSSD